MSCSHIWREHHFAMRCEQYAVVIYQDEAGLLHGFCARHLAAGINAAARHGWTIRVES